jgi:hypothetical protein
VRGGSCEQVLFVLEGQQHALQLAAVKRLRAVVADEIKAEVGR